jgi:hypothetical protein
VSLRAAVSNISHQVSRRIHSSTHLRRELASKLFEFLQLLSNLHFALFVQQHRDYRLRTACILYRLRREEEVVCRLVVECAVLWYVGWFLARRILEEEDDAVDVSE